MTALTDHDEHETGPGIVPEPKPSGRRSRRRPAAPASRFDPGRTAESRHRNPVWLVAGVLLVLLSALGGVLLFTSSDDRTDVLVAAGDLQPGQPITNADLRIERVALDDSVASIAPSAAGQLVGQLPVGRVPAGTLLASGMFAADVPLAANEVVVGAALDPGEAPLSGLEVGAAVELLLVDIATTGGPAADEDSGAAVVESPGAGAVPIGVGTVWAVEPIATGQLWVSMRVTRDVGLVASTASAEDRLRIVLIGGTP